MKAYKKVLLKPWFDLYPDYMPLGAKFRGLWQKRTLKRIIKEIDKRELDITIAEKVFGYKVEIIEVTEYLDYGGDVQHPELGFRIQQDENPELVKDGFDPYWYEEIELPYYSTDIKDAWQILRADNLPLDSFHLYFSDQHNPMITIRLEYNNDSWAAEGKTESEAICLAALKAVEHAKQ